MNELNNYIYDITEKSLRDVNLKDILILVTMDPTRQKKLQYVMQARLYLFKIRYLYQDNFFLNVLIKPVIIFVVNWQTKNKIFILRKS